MALYSELQVFKTCYDLLLLIFRATPNVKREYRYCLLENIKKDSVKLCTLIYRSNFAKNKDETLSQALESVMEIRLQCRVLRDLDQISIKLFIQLFETLDSASKQLTLWRKYHVENKGKIKTNNTTKTGVSNDSTNSAITTAHNADIADSTIVDPLSQLADTIAKLANAESQQTNHTTATSTSAPEPKA